MQIKGLRQKVWGALPKRKVRPRSPVAPPRSVGKQKLLPSRPKHIPDLTQRPAHILWQHHHAKAMYIQWKPRPPTSAEVSSCAKPTSAAEVFAKAQPKWCYMQMRKMQIGGLGQKLWGALPKGKVRPRSPAVPPRHVSKRKLPRPKHIHVVAQHPAAHTSWQHAAKTIQPPSWVSREEYMKDERLCYISDEARCFHASFAK